MTPSEAARILAVAALYDRRTVGEADALAWADALDGLAPRDCAEAVRRHYRDTTDWLMPAHIRRILAAQYRDAAQQRKDAETLRGIEAATVRHDRERSHELYLRTRDAFEQAIADAKAKATEGAD